VEVLKIASKISLHPLYVFCLSCGITCCGVCTYGGHLFSLYWYRFCSVCLSVFYCVFVNYHTTRRSIISVTEYLPVALFEAGSMIQQGSLPISLLSVPMTLLESFCVLPTHFLRKWKWRWGLVHPELCQSSDMVILHPVTRFCWFSLLICYANSPSNTVELFALLHSLKVCNNVLSSPYNFLNI
jgi:hypothetical protein